MEYSAGIIPFRRNEDGILEFFVGHPGGVGWQWRDYWAYLKGGVEENEKWEETALREFKEESGLELSGITTKDLIPLGTSKQNKKKIVVAYAIYYPDIDVDKCFSNLVEDGSHPEVDKYAWFTFEELKDKTHPMHICFYEQIAELVK